MSSSKNKKKTGIGWQAENLHKLMMTDKLHWLVGEHKKVATPQAATPQAVKQGVSAKGPSQAALARRLMRKIDSVASYLEAMSMDWDED